MDVVVVGSANMDTVLEVDRLPIEGETVTATRHFTNPGGKGANQAIAAARLGRTVAFVGAVGQDASGDALAASLAADGVDITHLARSSHPTGVALITVGSLGANTIVVSPGANQDVTPQRIAAASEVIAEADAVLVQLEIPTDAVEATLRAASGLTVLNPAPARPLPANILELADIIVPNETELAILTATDAYAGIPQSAAMLGERVVVTTGEAGAVYVDGADVGVVPAPVVEAVDTTAAGDAFCAALADALLAGSPLSDAVSWAVRVGSTTVTRPGAQAALPTRDEVL